ncbi:MAG TPA: ATP-binding protein [Gemmatimonadota bacterium]|nr:ATP-binding protein [Gemmatimonadota bacterium]
MRARLFLSLSGLSLFGLLLFVVLDRQDVSGAGAIAGIALVLIAAGLTRWLGRDVSAATGFAQQLSQGGSPRRLPEDVRGQAGDLFRALNRLAEAQRVRLQELGAGKAETEVLLREMGEGVLALGRDGRVVRANAELRSVIGAAEPVEGRSIASIFRNPQLVNFLAPGDLSADGATGEFEVFGRTMLVTARPLPSAGLVAVFSDVTELRRLDRVRTEFVANASHELKTPLTAIRGYAETLLDDGIPAEDRQSFAHRIVEHAGRMTSLVEDMLTLARLEEPGQRIEHQPVPLRPLAEALLASFADRARLAGVEIIIEIEPPDLEALADPEGVRRVLENLVDNAMRHAAPRHISIRAHATEPASLFLSVKDDGCGIPAARLDRIFERFYRVDPSRARQTGGTGLGLAIVRHWVELMGGEVWAESTLSDGAAFHVRLPALRSSS